MPYVDARPTSLLSTEGALWLWTDRQDPTADEDTANISEATVHLATHALDGLGLSDEELDTLCDAALGETEADHRPGSNEAGDMKKDKGSTTAQLRGDIDSGETGSKVAAPDPAASPLGTDDEAAGATPSADRVEMARNAERKIGEAAKRRGR